MFTSSFLADTPVPVTISIPLSVWVAWISSVSVGLGGVAIIFRFTTKASKLISDVNEYGSVVLAIAKEFKSDSGSSLKDAINRIEKAATEAKATSELAKAMTTNLTELVVNLKSPTK